jgi:thioredoxin 1
MILVLFLLVAALSEGLRFGKIPMAKKVVSSSRLSSVMPTKTERATIPSDITVTFPDEEISELKSVDDDTFYDEIAESKLAVVFFTSNWCGPCKSLESTLKDAACTFKGNADFLAVDIDECPDVASEFHIRSIPSILFFKDGEISSEIVGSAPAAVVSSQIENLIE